MRREKVCTRLADSRAIAWWKGRRVSRRCLGTTNLDTVGRRTVVVRALSHVSKRHLSACFSGTKGIINIEADISFQQERKGS